ncbi:hypothetical protein Bbelb_078370 [Branchiostoma belcheri]|nr:hypothetical protein Bbelb_078370 [Branchiostoma belcheri]
MAWSVAANIRQRGHGTGSRGGNASRERKQESDQQNMTYQQRLGATPAGYQQNPKLSPQRQHRDGQHRDGQQSGQQPGQQSGQHSRQQHSKSSSSSPGESRRITRRSSTLRQTSLTCTNTYHVWAGRPQGVLQEYSLRRGIIPGTQNGSWEAAIQSCLRWSAETVIRSRLDDSRRLPLRNRPCLVADCSPVVHRALGVELQLSGVGGVTVINCVCPDCVAAVSGKPRASQEGKFTSNATKRTEHAQQHMSRSLPHEYMRHFPQDAMRRQEEHAQSATRRSPTQPRRRYRQHHDTTADTERIKTRSSPEKHSSRQTQDGEKDRRQRQSYTSSV